MKVASPSPPEGRGGDGEGGRIEVGDMGRLKIEVVDTPIRRHDARGVHQGDVWVGPEPQATILGSCICIGFYHAPSRIGGVSHVTGFSHEGGHCAAGAFEALRKGLARHRLEPGECECFVIGGSDRARKAYDDVRAELMRQGLRFQEMDVLGECHRKLLLEPDRGVVTLYNSAEAAGRGMEGVFSSETAGRERFSDPLRRVATGASALFRNEALLAELRRGVLADVVKRTGRLHVWCAGCSNGMEAYSIAMALLEWLRGSAIEAPLRVLGSDIADDALETARQGVYPLSGRVVGTHGDWLARYAEPVDAHTTRMGARLREVVLFKKRDISAGSRIHRFELVVCDHVLQYYPEEAQIEFLTRLVKAVQPDGYLYASTPTPSVRDAIARDFGFAPVARNLYRGGSSPS